LCAILVVMLRTAWLGAIAVAVLLLVGERGAAAMTYTLPNLGWTLERAEWGATWTFTKTTSDDGSTHDEIVVPGGRILVTSMTSNLVGWEDCEYLMMVAIMSKQYDYGTIGTSGYLWGGWVPFYVSSTNGAPQVNVCRILHPGSLNVIIYPDDPADPFGGDVWQVVNALDKAATAAGYPAVVQEQTGAEFVAYIEQRAEELRAEEAAASAPAADTEVATTTSYAPSDDGGYDAGSYTPPVPEPAPRDDRSWYQRMSSREGRYEGTRLQLEYGNASIDGAPEAKRTRVGATLRVPPRYRKAYADVGLVYAGSASVAKLDGLLTADGQVGIGGAIGGPDGQLAGLIVLGADRVVAGATPATIDSVYGGGAALLRVGLGDHGAALEASAALMTGSHGGEARVDASLITLHFAPLSALIGVRYDGWNGGSTTSAFIGIGL
jgi:hypothetical protein